MSKVSAPSRAAFTAAANPAGPPPTTNTSTLLTTESFRSGSTKYSISTILTKHLLSRKTPRLNALLILGQQISSQGNA